MRLTPRMGPAPVSLSALAEGASRDFLQEDASVTSSSRNPA